MIKPIGYMSKYGLKNLSQGFSARIFPQTRKMLVHKVPVFTLDQVMAMVEKRYKEGVEGGLCFDYEWDESEIKAQLDAIAAQAAGGEG